MEDKDCEKKYVLAMWRQENLSHLAYWSLRKCPGLSQLFKAIG